MNKYTLLLISIYCMICVNAFADDTRYGSNYGNVTSITLMGELWQNSNRGGFLFKTDNLPSSPYTVDYFIVRGESEKYVNRLLSALLSAKSMNKKVAVNYKVFNLDNPDATEGDVIAITIE